jgi:transcription antitermination factor NusA-like protein
MMKSSLDLEQDVFSEALLQHGISPSSLGDEFMHEAEWGRPSYGPSSDDLNAKRLAFHAGPCWLKLLVVDRVAGSIIGKGGKVITEIEQTCNCIMKLSPGHTFFPGTQERIVVIAGSVEGISEAVGIILEKIRQYVLSELRNRQVLYGNNLRDENFVDITVRAVVPNSAVSCIIGRGGEVVKEINRSTGATIRIGDRMMIVHERIVQVTGSLDQCHAALCEVLTRIQTDKNLREHLNVVYTKAASMQMASPAPQIDTSPTPSPPSSSSLQVQTPSGPIPINAFQDISPSPNMYAQPCSISLSVPPESVSPSTLRRIEAQTGAAIRYRRTSSSVQISGVFGAVHTAHILLLKETSTNDSGVYTPGNDFPAAATPSPTARRGGHNF